MVTQEIIIINLMAGSAVFITFMILINIIKKWLDEL